MALASRRLVAGSGKTEVVAQRVADLLAGGADAASIIAFTFTERAAAELKARISGRVEERLGTAALDRLGATFLANLDVVENELLEGERLAGAFGKMVQGRTCGAGSRPRFGT